MTRWERARKRFTSPRLWFRIHLAAALVWVVLIVPTMGPWRNSVAWLNFMTIYGLIVVHVTGMVAVLGARKADPEDPL